MYMDAPPPQPDPPPCPWLAHRQPVDAFVPMQEARAREFGPFGETSQHTATCSLVKIARMCDSSYSTHQAAPFGNGTLYGYCRWVEEVEEYTDNVGNNVIETTMGTCEASPFARCGPPSFDPPAPPNTQYPGDLYLFDPSMVQLGIFSGLAATVCLLAAIVCLLYRRNLQLYKEKHRLDFERSFAMHALTTAHFGSAPGAGNADSARGACGARSDDGVSHPEVAHVGDVASQGHVCSTPRTVSSPCSVELQSMPARPLNPLDGLRVAHSFWRRAEGVLPTRSQPLNAMLEPAGLLAHQWPTSSMGVSCSMVGYSDGHTGNGTGNLTGVRHPYARGAGMPTGLYPRPQIRSPGSGCSSSTYGSNGELGAIFGPVDLDCPSPALTSTVRAVTEPAEGVRAATGADKEAAMAATATAATLMQLRLQRTLMQLGIEPFTPTNDVDEG